MAPPLKKRKVAPSSAPEEITFDENARQDYLTGFHKRKVARTKHAQEIAIKKEKEERIRERAQLRQKRQQELEDHVKAVNDAVKQFTAARQTGARGWEDDEVDGRDETEWNGLEEVPEINREDEYIDEEKYTTVTVESVEIGKTGLHTIGAEDDEDDKEAQRDDKDTAANGRSSSRNGTREHAKPKPIVKGQGKKPRSKDKSGLEGPEKKKKKFRYERGESRKEVQKRAKDKRNKREEKEKTLQKGPQRRKKTR